MTDQEKEVAKQILSKKYLEQKSACESDMEVKMLDRQYAQDLEKINNGINPFEKPDNSPYQCEGCGS